jgi:hypothetical protein
MLLKYVKSLFSSSKQGPGALLFIKVEGIVSVDQGLQIRRIRLGPNLQFGPVSAEFSQFH